MKGQIAMEYLMTWGWAILIVIIVAVALIVLGVFDPDNYYPNEKFADECDNLSEIKNATSSELIMYMSGLKICQLKFCETNIINDIELSKCVTEDYKIQKIENRWEKG
jgi:hypothetical protein